MLFPALRFYLGDEDDTFLRNVGSNKTHTTAFFLVTAVKT
jgi:hypothetical protein